MNTCAKIPGYSVYTPDKYYNLAKKNSARYHSIDVSVAATVGDVFRGELNTDNFVNTTYKKRYIEY